MKQRPFFAWFLYFFFGLIILSLINPLFSSRAPAVDPIVGLSIDEESVISPVQVKGFNFRSQNLKILRPPTDQTLVKNIIQIFSLLFLLSLPFAIWNRILPNSKEESQKQKLKVIKGGKQEKTNQKNEDDDDENKAA